MIVSRAFSGKHYAVLGLARSGLASVRALVESGAHVTGWDSNEDARAGAADYAKLADFEHGDLSGFDAIVVSPGVPLNRHPIAAKAREAGVPIIGDIELFAQARADLPPHKVVAITGTNGKSTTTALVHHILKTAGWATTMGGNIGLPILEQGALPQGGVYVLELSSYQIDLMQNLDADVAALLNITPDHLDRYADFGAYAAAKARLFRMQSSGHAAIFGDGDGETRSVCDTVKASRPDDVKRAQSAPEGQGDWPALQGPHNAQNVAVAVAVVEALGLTEAEWRPALQSFAGLAHRMELIGERCGVRFINDSKATNPASTAPALAAFDKIRWICGGQAKADNLDDCAPYFSHVRSAHLIGEAAPMFARLFDGKVAADIDGTLDHAVSAAAAAAEPGDVVLLSPACASFDQFRDFEARGDAFRAAVAKLPEGARASAQSHGRADHG